MNKEDKKKNRGTQERNAFQRLAERIMLHMLLERLKDVWDVIKEVISNV